MNDIKEYKYRGARALIVLQEQQLRSLLSVWKEAKKNNIILPETDDKDYQSLESLLFHIFRASRGYLTWICEKLELPDPQIDKPPALEEIEQKADNYLEYLLGKWRDPLADLPQELFFNKIYKSRWGVEYCIEAMLEHAVTHPMRHEFQLLDMIGEKK
jgi:uncharacterized damage-inducible protein DinB